MEYGLVLAAVVLVWFTGFVTGVGIGQRSVLEKLKAFSKTNFKTPEQIKKEHIESLNPNKYRKSDD